MVFIYTAKTIFYSITVNDIRTVIAVGRVDNKVRVKALSAISNLIAKFIFRRIGYIVGAGIMVGVVDVAAVFIKP